MRSRSALTLALALSCVTIPGAAARVLARPAAAVPPARALVPETRDGACGTRAGAAAERLAEHLERAASVPLATSHSTDAGAIAVIEDDGTYFFPDKDGHVHLDLAAVTNAFYRTHGDDYDFLAVFLASGQSDWLGSPTAFAAEFGIRNPTQGIGLDLYDYGADFGSAARLQAVLSMNGMERYPDDPTAVVLEGDLSSQDILAHELAHRWCAYVWVDSAGVPSPALLGRAHQHWNFFVDTDASVMDGCSWRVAVAPDSFHTDSVTTGYGRLDLYLMGLMDKAEVGSVLEVEEPVAFQPPGDYVPAYPPQKDLGCRGRAQWWTIADIEAANGPRVPDAASAPHAFRLGFVLVTPNGSGASSADLARLETLRSSFPSYFFSATRGRGALDCTLDSRAGSVWIAHQPLPDTEDATAPRPVGCRAGIAPGGIPIALDSSTVRALWRPAGGSGWTTIPLGSAGADSFAGTLPALGATGDAEYLLYAASDSAGIDATAPPGGTAAPFRYHAGPDLTPPTIAHAPVHDQGAARMPQTLLARITDNLGLDSAWVEYAVDGGALQTKALARAGRDSFAVALGAGLASGQRLTYRFVARDRAAAANLAYSAPAPETLRVGRGWWDEFENGDDGFTHAPQWYSYRDAWHLTSEDSSPGGGTAWKCGAWGAGDYPPHLDSNLYTPVITDLEPGTLLQFDHRYDLEAADELYAWDGARVEGSSGGGPWVPLAPAAGYPFQFYSNSNPFQKNTPCWSGSSGGWRSEVVDLTPLAPGPARVRFRMLADDLIGYGGWLVDHVRLVYPGTTGVEPPAASPTVGRPYPNPARAELRLGLSLAHPARVDWALYDVAGRRVAALWRGGAPAGTLTLSGALGPVPAGLYFARLRLDGREAARARVAVVR